MLTTPLKLLVTYYLFFFSLFSLISMDKVEASSTASSPSEAQEVTEEFRQTLSEQHLPKINCPEHIVSMMHGNLNTHTVYQVMRCLRHQEITTFKSCVGIFQCIGLLSPFHSYTVTFLSFYTFLVIVHFVSSCEKNK